MDMSPSPLAPRIQAPSQMAGKRLRFGRTRPRVLSLTPRRRLFLDSGEQPRRFANFQRATRKRQLVGSLLPPFQFSSLLACLARKINLPFRTGRYKVEDFVRHTYPARSLYRLGSMGKMPADPHGQDGCVTRKALVQHTLFLQFPGGSWQIANSAVSRSFYSWRFAQAWSLMFSWLLLSSAASVRA